MEQIPEEINGIKIEFATTAGRLVSTWLVQALRHTLHADAFHGYTLERIYISSAKDSHNSPSRHVLGKAVDISRINGHKLAVYYKTNLVVKAIADGLQKRFETFPQKRENFGPRYKKKLGLPFKVDGHEDHIHFSVN